LKGRGGSQPRGSDVAGTLGPVGVKTIVFSHGKDSEPWGTKIVALAEAARSLRWRVESVDYRGIDSVEGRLEKLLDACRELPPHPVLVGSSLGGYLAAAASRPVSASGLFLMAPAFDLPGLPPTPVAEPCPTVVIHGWRDDVVPVAKGLAFAEKQRALTYLVDDDHRLHATLPRMVGWLREFLGGFDA
jgi:pimeloyl-ACP methyl ester carboxylesterase